MREFDRLPKDLRCWLANAALPWGPYSARRVYQRVLAATGSPAEAIRELDRRQALLLARDAQCVWGTDFPGTTVKDVS